MLDHKEFQNLVCVNCCMFGCHILSHLVKSNFAAINIWGQGLP